VPRSVHSLDPASGAKVQHRANPPIEHEPAERHGCPTNAEHVIRAERRSRRQFAQVACKPPAADTVRVDETVGPKVLQGVAAHVDQPQFDGTGCRQGRECFVDVTDIRGQPEHEESSEGGERGGCCQGAHSGKSLCAVKSRGRIWAPQGCQCPNRKVRGEQVGAKRGHECHRIIQSHPHGVGLPTAAQLNPRLQIRKRPCSVITPE